MWACIYMLVTLVIPFGLVVRIPGFHPGGPGSIPGVGITFLLFYIFNYFYQHDSPAIMTLRLPLTSFSMAVRTCCTSVSFSRLCDISTTLYIKIT